ncbi:protein MIZU-KUSSEI 1 [Nymphaea colorata]|nr:protein MIZU-KUSSEI 1 [Nymphaea colorata]
MEIQSRSPQAMSLLRHKTDKRSRTSRFFGLFSFKLLPKLTTGCKMVFMLGRPRSALFTGKFATGTLFGYRRGKVCLALQEDPTCFPMFMLELPMSTSALLKEMASGLVRIALECETRTHKKRLLEEMVWAVYCNGRKTGYSIKKKQISEEEETVMQMLRGVSMGAGVLPCQQQEKETADDELTYLRSRFERVIGSKDSEAFYMMNPDGNCGQELSIFFVRM